MIAECFLDANVLVYAVSKAPAEAEKKKRARELIEQEDFGVSAQVLQEFYVTVTRKLSAAGRKYDDVAQVSKPAVSPTSSRQTVLCSGGRPSFVRALADLEIRETAGLETCATEYVTEFAPRSTKALVRTSARCLRHLLSATDMR